MPQPKPFVRSFAQLVWLLIHRHDALEEQKVALRKALSQAMTQPHELVLTDLNVSVAEAAHAQPAPEELPWIGELSLRLAGHSVRSVSFQSAATANDVLSLARALTLPAVPADEGASFDAKIVALALTSVHVYYGREGFVRRATPALGHTFIGPARTPALGIAAVAPSGVRTPTPMPVRNPTPSPVRYPTPSPVRNATPSPLRIPTPVAGSLPPGFEDEATVSLDKARANTGAAKSNMPDDTTRIYETALSVGNGASRELEQLLARIDAPLGSHDAAKAMEEVARAAETRATDGLWVDVVEIARRLIAREETEKDADVKRAVVLAVRRIMKPGILRGMALLLPRRRELRDDIMMVLSRSRELGSDVLLDLLVATESAPERRVYRLALTHCPEAVPALSHLLGDARWFVVRNVAELLGEMGVTDADGKLALTAKHADARVRRAAVAALARLGTPRSLHALQQALKDKTHAVRLAAAIGLGTIRNPRAVPPVIEALDKEDDPDVQGALLAALGSMPTSEAVDRLKRAAEPGGLMHRKPTSLRLHAIQALGDAATHSALSVLRGFANDRDKEVRAKVDRLLGQRAYAS